MPVMPPHTLELREEKGGTLSDIPVSGGLAKTLSQDGMALELEVEKKLEYELLQEHLKIELFYGVALNKILNIPDETNLEEGIVAGDDNFIRHGPGGPELAHSKNAEERRGRILSVFSSLPQTPEASEVRRTNRELADITKTAKREVDELLLLNMVIGRCRVCRRLGR